MITAHNCACKFYYNDNYGTSGYWKYWPDGPGPLTVYWYALLYKGC